MLSYPLANEYSASIGTFCISSGASLVLTVGGAVGVGSGQAAVRQAGAFVTKPI